MATVEEVMTPAQADNLRFNREMGGELTPAELARLRAMYPQIERNPDPTAAFAAVAPQHDYVEGSLSLHFDSVDILTLRLGRGGVPIAYFLSAVARQMWDYAWPFEEADAGKAATLLVQAAVMAAQNGYADPMPEQPETAWALGSDGMYWRHYKSLLLTAGCVAPEAEQAAWYWEVKGGGVLEWGRERDQGKAEGAAEAFARAAYDALGDALALLDDEE